jgi:pimeloyl-ACP methyl ester carboxylesterase
MKSRLSGLWVVAILCVEFAQNLCAFQDLPVQFAAGPVRLAGTLTLPETPGSHPVLVLIAGGQAIDRDCSYSGGRYKFFKIIAEDLAKNGFATLRFDSPGVGGSTGGKWDQRTLNDRADEVANAVQFLKQNKRIDAQRIGLLGHSEGADVAVTTAVKNKDVAYLVLLAPHAKSVRESFSTFRAYLVKDNGGSESKEAQAVWDGFYAHTVFPAVDKDQADWQAILEQGTTIARKAYDNLPPQEQSKFKDFDAYFRSTVDNFYLTYAPTTIPHLRSVLDFNPVKYYEQIRLPVLLVGGEADYFAGDIPALAQAVGKSGNTNCMTRIVPKAGHTLDNPAVSQEQPVPELLPTVSRWLERVTSPDPLK